MKYTRILFLAVVAVLSLSCTTFAADFYVGSATADYTPSRPVYLQGQMHTRVSRGIDTPIIANILALESREGQKQLDCAVMVAMDMCSVPLNLYNKMIDDLKKALPELPSEKVFFAATHSHTSIATKPGAYVSDEKNILEGDEAAAFISSKVVPGIVTAWKNRAKGSMAFGLGFADVACNRRAVYKDGRAVMYGSTEKPDFRSVEGIEDHDINSMFFWNAKNELLAMIVNVSCPSQVVEGLYTVNADYWHPVRELIHKKYGQNVVVLGLCGAAGDMAPRPQYLKKAESRMAELRGFNRMEELARRITRAVDETYSAVEKSKTNDVPLIHRYAILDLPQQKVSKELCEEFKAQAASYDQKRKAAKDRGASGPYVLYNWTNRVVKRYEGQQGVANPTYPIPVHTIRIGQTAICTNPFELYTDFGIEMKSRSRAVQTFIVQLSDSRGISGYLPSAFAVRGGGYGAIPQSNFVGAEGGHVLVEKTLEMLNPLFNNK